MVNDKKEQKFKMRLNSVFAHISYSRDGKVYTLNKMFFPGDWGLDDYKEIITKLTFDYIVRSESTMNLKDPVLVNYYNRHKHIYEKFVVEVPKPPVVPVEKPIPKPPVPVDKHVYTLTHHPKNKQFIMNIEKNIGFVQYKMNEGAYDLVYVMIPSKYRNLGLGHVIAELVFDYIASENGNVILSCRFMKRAFSEQKHKYDTHLVNPQLGIYNMKHFIQHVD